MRIVLGENVDMPLPLPLASIAGAQAAWQLAVVECNDVRLEQEAASFTRICCLVNAELVSVITGTIRVCCWLSTAGAHPPEPQLCTDPLVIPVYWWHNRRRVR